jgi:hypothetical protein
MGHTMMTLGDVMQTAGESPPQTEAVSIPDGGDMGELPREFHKRLAQLLAAFLGATLASVQPGKQPGSWAVEVRFSDRRETLVVNYARDQVAI